MKVKDAMHRSAHSLDDVTPLREVARRMRDADLGAIPISAAGEFVRIVRDRAIACRGVIDGAEVGEMTARDVMTRNPACCAPDDDLSDAVRLVEARRIRRLPVITDGLLIGMLSLGDVSNRADDAMSAEVLRAVATHH